MSSFELRRRIVRIRLFGFLSIFLLAAFCMPVGLRAQLTTLSMRTPGVENAGATDVGAVSDSEPLQVVIRLAITPDRSAALDQLLMNQTTHISPSYHKWLTPSQFGGEFGASDEELAAVTAWVASHGLAVNSVSPARTRIVVSGTAAQLESAFSVTLRRYQIVGALYFANSTEPSIPAALASLIAGISGLDDLPKAWPISVTTFGARSATADDADALVTASSAVDANTATILAFTTNACSTDYLQSDYDGYRDLLRQANAQGMTVLATSGCGVRGTGSFPASLAEATAVTVTPVSANFVGISARPGWQSAPGLPADAERHETDLTASSLNAFAQTVNAIVQQNGSRLGNINATLYALAPTKGLYTQPDATPATVAGSWEPSTGLGVVDLATLLKVYPRDTVGAATTTSTPGSSSPAVSYGNPLVLTATVTASTTVNNTPPSGTVSFTSSQGTTVRSALLANGMATLNLSSLNAGTYTLFASYSGDGNYSASTSAGSVMVTVSPVNAGLVATISPAANVPYGATATVTATVTLPTISVSPTGTVTAQVEGLTGASANAVLSPNPGGNSATANITVSVPPPGISMVQVTCAGNQNFQCQTPVNIAFTTVKGNTLASVSATPAAPQAGQPINLTATIGNAGNGMGAYTFSGGVTFYDNGKFLASAVVANNQATATKALSGAVTHNIVASYNGDTNWNGSTSAAQAVTPTLLTSTMTLTANVASLSAALAGTNTVLTATVFTPVVSGVVPTGAVSFFNTYNGSVVPLGVSTLVSNGPNQSIAVFSTTGLPAGTDNIYAVYEGDANFSTATSSSLLLTFSDYNITMVPQTLTLSRGQSGQVVMLAGIIVGFSGSINFGCTPPAGAEMSCSFSPVSLNGGGSTTMTIVTTAPVAGSSTATALVERKMPWNMVAGTSLAALFCFVAPRRRRLPILLLLLCAIGLTADLGCGQGVSTTPASGTAPPLDPGSPLGTQIFTVTTAGSDGVNTVRHLYQYQVTIQ